LQAFTDKKVLVTGAGRGIGKRLALGFAAAGARLGLLARSKAELELTRLEIEHAGGSATRLVADVRNYPQLKAAADRMRARFGDIDILVCAAAVQGPIGPVWETSPKAWGGAVETNLLGVLNSCRVVLPAMVKRRSGKIIVLAGAGATRPRPNFSAYAASKAAVVRLVETIAAEVREHNIQANCLAPGVRMTGGAPPEKQIELALFLASEKSNHISGKLIHIQDNWKRLANTTVNAELYTLRRIRKI